MTAPTGPSGPMTTAMPGASAMPKTEKIAAGMPNHPVGMPHAPAAAAKAGKSGGGHEDPTVPTTVPVVPRDEPWHLGPIRPRR